MVPFDVATGRDYMVSQSGSVTTLCESLKMFSLPIMQSSFRFTDVERIAVGKTKRRLHDRKTEHFKALSQGCHASALADHVISTGHNIKWDHFDILATGTKVQLTVQN